MANPWDAYSAPSPTNVGTLRRGEGDDPYVYDEAGTPYDPRNPPPDATFTGSLAPEAAETEDEPVGEMEASAAPPADPAAPWAQYGGSPEETGLTGTITDEGIYDGVRSAKDQVLDGPQERGAARTGWDSGWTFGLDDEIGAGAYAAGRAGLSALGLKDDKRSIGEMYRDRVAELRRQKEQAWGDNPWAYAAGATPGVIGTGFLMPGARAAQAETLMGRLAQASGQSAMGGALTGAGNADGDLADMGMGSIVGGFGGAALGPLMYPLGLALSNVGSRFARALSPRANNLNSGLEELAVRAPQDVDAMRARAATMPDARLVDVVDESGRGVIRDAASKMTPAREEVVRHADQIYSGAQDRVVNVARQNIDPNPQTARQLERQIRGDKNLGGEDEAGVLMGQEMEPLRSRPIQIDDDIKAVLATREGQAALRGAEGLMTDPADRAAARAMLAAARKAAKGPADPEDAFRAEVKGWDDLPEPVKKAYREQRPDLLEAGDPFKGVTMTLDMADKFARAMRGRAASTPGLERVARDFANTVRGSARTQVPEYDAALNAYQGSQRVADAAGGTGNFEESRFLGTPADTYEASVQQASREPAAVRSEGGDPTVSETDALIRRARDEVVDAATAGSGASAGRVARQIAFGGGDTGAGQAARSRALLGEERAANLQQGMENEVARVRNTRFIDPTTGSQTQSRAQDAIVDGFIDAAANVKSGGVWSIAKVAARWLRQGGIRNVDAERLSRDAISNDPARVEQAIAFLEQRGMARERAQRFVAGISSAFAGRAAGVAATEE